MPEFTYDASYSSTNKTKNKVLEAEFGDGYKQSVYDGINYRMREFRLVFDNRSNTEINEIENFFINNQTPITSFDWIPPGKVLAKFLCKEWDITYTGPTTGNLTCIFTEVFS